MPKSYVLAVSFTLEYLSVRDEQPVRTFLLATESVQSMKVLVIRRFVSTFAAATTTIAATATSRRAAGSQHHVQEIGPSLNKMNILKSKFSVPAFVTNLSVHS